MCVYNAIPNLAALSPENCEWLMTVSAFFDESGKSNDHKVISIGGVASFDRDHVEFGYEWARLLHMNGLKELSAKHVLNPMKPLSKKNDSVGLDTRIADLLPFMLCIRKHLQVITATAIDVEVFNGLPSHVHEFWSKDPVYMAVARSVLQVIE